MCLFSILLRCERVLCVEWGVCVSRVVFVRCRRSFEVLGNSLGVLRKKKGCWIKKKACILDR